MPIGATIGAAVVGAGAGIYSSSKAASAQNKAANQASDTALQVANTNNAFAQNIYDQNEGHLTPFIDFGTAAGGDLMEMLTGKKAAAPATGSTGSTGTTTTPKPATGYTGPGLGAIGSQSQMDAYLGYYRAHPDQDPGFTSIAPFHGDAYRDEDSANAVLQARNAYLASHPATTTPAAGTPAAGTPAAGTPATTTAAVRPRLVDYQGDMPGFRNALAAYRTQTTGATPAAGTPAAGGTPATTGNAAQDAWNKFRNSTNYTFRLDQGLNSTATKYAAAGAFESGAEKKAINDYAQNFASNELANYQDQLYRQEALGAQAASSLAGVGTNLVSQVSANNNNAGNAAANAALIHGQNSANMWGTVGNAVGQVAGAVGGAFPSSYGGGTNGGGYSGYDYGPEYDF